MSGPWDNYATPPTATGAPASGPWSNYAPAAPKPSPRSPINAGDASIGAGVVSGIGGAALGTAQLAGHLLTQPTMQPPTDGPMAGPNAAMANITRLQNIPGEAISSAAEKGLDWLKGQVQPYQQAHPDLYGAGDIAGQIGAAALPGAAAGDIADASTIGRRLVQGAYTGGVAGAEQPITGPGYGRQKVEETLGNIAGGVTGAGLTEAASGIAKHLIRNAPDVIKYKAVQKIASKIAASEKAGGPKAQDIIDLMHTSHAAQVPLTLMESGNADLRAMAGSLARTQGAPRTIIEKSFRDRLAASTTRLTAAVRRNFDAPQTRRQVSSALTDSQIASSRPLYEQAFKPGSLAPLKKQFASMFNDISKSRKEAEQELSVSNQAVTNAQAKISRSGHDVYSSSSALQELRDAQSNVEDANSKLYALKNTHTNVLGQLREAQRAEAAGERGAVWSPYIARLMNNPNLKVGIKRGMAIQRNEADARNIPFNPTDYGVRENAQGEQEVFKTPNMRVLDAAKRGLDEMLEDYRDPVTGRLNLDQNGRSINELRVSLLNELDRINPDYSEARAAYAGPAASKSAMKQGEQILSAHPEDVKSIFDRLSPSEQEHYRIGAAQAYIDAISKFGVGGTTIGKTSKDEIDSAARDRLLPIFRTAKQRDDFISSVTGERAIHNTMRSVLGGSETAGRIAEDAQSDVGPYMEALENATIGLAHAKAGHLAGVMRSFYNAKERFSKIINPGVQAELARIISNPNLELSKEPGQVLPMFQNPMERRQFSTLPMASALGIAPGDLANQSQDNQ